jgi:hypothetical protein
LVDFGQEMTLSSASVEGSFERPLYVERIVESNLPNWQPTESMEYPMLLCTIINNGVDQNSDITMNTYREKRYPGKVSLCFNNIFRDNFLTSDIIWLKTVFMIASHSELWFNRVKVWQMAVKQCPTWRLRFVWFHSVVSVNSANKGGTISCNT